MLKVLIPVQSPKVSSIELNWNLDDQLGIPSTLSSLNPCSILSNVE